MVANGIQNMYSHNIFYNKNTWSNIYYIFSDFENILLEID